MAFEQISPTTAREGNRYRITAGPTHCTVGEVLRPIADVLSVTRSALTGAYRVAVGGDWIMFTPEKQRGTVKRAIVEIGRFGDVLAADGGHDDVIRYNAARTAGVEAVADGWRFTAIRDVSLGVFLANWRAEFGERMTLAEDYVTLDTVGLTGDENGEINLDPETFEADVSRSLRTTNNATWAIAIGSSPATPTIISGTQALVYAYDHATQHYGCARGYLRFDTSALSGIVASAKLRLTADSSLWSGNATTDLEIYDTDTWADPFAGLPNWNLAASHRLTVDLAGVSAGQQFTTTDIPGAVDWVNTGGMTYLQLRSSWDYEEDDGFSGLIRLYMKAYNDATPANRPALIVTMATFAEVGGHRIYRGTTPANIDWTTPVASVVMDGEEATIVGEGHAAGLTYFYGCRPETPSGLLTPDLSNIVEFTLDDGGEWPGSRPARVPVFDVEQRPAAVLRAKWRYDLPSSNATPDSFSIWHSTDKATLGSGAADASVAYSGPRWYREDFSLADGTRYWFLIRAVTGDAISSGHIVGPFLADSTAPAVPSVAVETGF